MIKMNYINSEQLEMLNILSNPVLILKKLVKYLFRF